MKTVTKIFSYITAAIVAILALVMTVIEARLLFSGEWLLHESVPFAFIRYLLRTLFALFGVFAGVSAYIKYFDKHQLFIAGTLASVSFAIFFFVTNGIEWLFLIPSLIHLGVTAIRSIANKCK